MDKVQKSVVKRAKYVQKNVVERAKYVQKNVRLML